MAPKRKVAVKATRKAAKKTPKAPAGKATRKAAGKSAAAKTPASTTPRTLTPYLAIRGAGEAIDWYRKTWGAKEVDRMAAPGGGIMHAELRLGDSTFYVSDIFPGSDVQDARDLKATTVNIHFYSRNVDKLWEQAVAAGATVTMPLEDQFWGDRYGRLIDPFGQSWALSYKSKLGKAELERKREEAMKQFQGLAPM